MRTLAHIFVCLCLLSPTGLSAQSGAAAQAQAAAAKLETAQQSLQEAKRARDRVAALTETIHAYEDGLVALRESLRLAARQEAVLRVSFEAERDRLAALLATMQAMQAQPETMLLHPEGPLATAQAGMIMAEVWPAMETRVNALRRDLEEVVLLQSLQESAAVSLEQGLAQVQQARLNLGQAIAERTDLPRRFHDDPEAMQALINGSETLQAFASGLASLPETDAVAPVDAVPNMPKDLDLPVNGTILRRYNEPDAANIVHPGWVIATQPQALVSAPWPATIRYRGPLLSYGNVIILEPQQDLLMVFAGLGAVYGEVGEIVAKGAPLGLMPYNQFTNDAELSGAIVIDAGAARTETLYMEIRKDQQPLDPAFWFAGEKD